MTDDSLACGSNDNTVWVWDTATWKIVRKSERIDNTNLRENALKDIYNYLYRFSFKIQTGINNRVFSVMTMAEHFYTHLINLAYGWELEQASKGHYLDCYDPQRRIALEIISTMNTYSVNKMVDRIINRDGYEDYEIYILVAGEFESKKNTRLIKQKLDSHKLTLWYTCDLYRRIESLSYSSIDKIKQYCEAVLSTSYVGSFELKVQNNNKVSFRISSDVAYTFHITQLQNYVLEFPDNNYYMLKATGNQKREGYAALFEVINDKKNKNDLVDILSRYEIDDGDTILIDLTSENWLQYKSVIKGTIDTQKSLDYQASNDLNVIDTLSSSIYKKTLRLISLKIINEGKELCNIRFVPNNKKVFTNCLYSTVIIGINGVGKSFALKGISDVFSYLAKIKDGKKNDSKLDYGQYELQYYLNGDLVNIIARNSKVSLSVNKEWIGLTTGVLDKYLPPRILVSSFMVNDKFKYMPYDADSASNYIYLGIRKGSNVTFTSQFIERIQENIYYLIKRSRFTKLQNNLLPYLGFDPYIIIRFNLKTKDVSEKESIKHIDLRGKDLSYQDFSNKGLSFSDISRASLHGIDLQQAVLDYADLHESDLTSANLSNSSLRNADLRYVDISESDLTKADLSGANLAGSDLTKANLRGANLTGANLTGANLTFADLHEADLKDADFSRANLYGARFDCANMAGTIFENALIEEASFENTIERYYNNAEEVIERALQLKQTSLSVVNNELPTDGERQNFLENLNSILGGNSRIINSEYDEFKVVIPLDKADNLYMKEVFNYLDYDQIDNKSIMFRKDGLEYSLNELSSGELNLLYTFSNILYWIEPYSLILIDEPDLSLHPEWQLRYVSFLKKLLECYKGCHVIMATHSHYFVSDLEAMTSSIVTIIKKDGKREAKLLDYSTYAWSAENILYNVFNVRTTRNYYFEKDLHELIDLVSKQRKDKLDRIVELHKKLERYVFDDRDPLLRLLNEVKEFYHNAES